MEIMGLCSICGKPGEMFTCHLCGRIVCRDCYDAANGICINCKVQRSV
ncbi:MAG: orotate phosphoribosyltransferase [Thermoplasmata archaeon]|nr:orotate phosphoribosyltransferase [Thermoplasmata archaeon]RLF44904.1 MAG: orotate phosphoribosyltransferase [Thermoplasmata archaeon]HEC87277.1 orotate phosphoribosyltransferase [Thermoplasmatales archaeon]